MSFFMVPLKSFRLRGFLGLVFMLLVSGCNPMATPESFFELSPTYNKEKALQTRFFETSNYHELVSASAAVLQDLGFQVEESEPDVGLLRAVKERSAREWGQEIGRVFIAMIGIVGQKVILLPVDLQQQIVATLTVFPVNNNPNRFGARIIFDRKIWKGGGSDGSAEIPPGEQRLEIIDEPLIYQEFFSKLSKSVFLEAHQI
jgi:hypothetical protein